MVKYDMQSLNVTENDANLRRPRPIRNLLVLALAFIVGFVCTRCLRFTHPVPNELFGAAVLALPFLALRPLSQLPRIPKIIGRIALTPVLLFALLIGLTFVACGDLELQPGKNSCMEELGRVDQHGYSVHLLRNGCGGAAVGFMLIAEQRVHLSPGLYLVRSLALFDGAYEGTLTTAGPTQIRIRIPKSVEGSGWNQEIDRVFQLKPHVYF
jgi:hypothetical protein